MDCLFCKIVAGEIPATKVYEDDTVVAFNDIKPQAPVHVLIIPKKHIATTNDISEEDEKVVGHLLTTAAKLAKEFGVDGSGFRSVMNCNDDAGQEVYHLHLHVLGGRILTWPPG